MRARCNFRIYNYQYSNMLPLYLLRGGYASALNCTLLRCKRSKLFPRFLRLSSLHALNCMARARFLTIRLLSAFVRSPSIQSHSTESGYLLGHSQEYMVRVPAARALVDYRRSRHNPAPRRCRLLSSSKCTLSVFYPPCASHNFSQSLCVIANSS
jgi:hypothetical protein